MKLEWIASSDFSRLAGSLGLAAPVSAPEQLIAENALLRQQLFVARPRKSNFGEGPNAIIRDRDSKFTAPSALLWVERFRATPLDFQLL